MIVPQAAGEHAGGGLPAVVGLDLSALDTDAVQLVPALAVGPVPPSLAAAPQARPDDPWYLCLSEDNR